MYNISCSYSVYGNLQTVICRTSNMHFQWLHEESLISPDSHYPWVGPQRSMLLTTIKKVHVYTFCSLTISPLPSTLTHSLTHTHHNHQTTTNVLVTSPFHHQYACQVLSEQMATSLTSVLDRINSQWFRISQRLQWAAGSNSQLNATIDEFERAMNRRKMILQVRQ